MDMARHLPECDLPIDTGIAYAVAVLRSGGVETFESCEGGGGHSFREPTVRFYGNSAAGYHAFSVAMNYGLPIAELQRYWTFQEGELVGPQWQMTFYRKCPMPAAEPLPKDERKAIGGHARAQALSPERRRDIARQAAQKRWNGKERVARSHAGAD